jgi:hypothetical protein
MIKLDSKKFRYVLIGVFLLCIIGFIGVFVLGSSTLKKKSNEMVNLKLQNQNADTELANLQAAKKQVEKYSYFKNIASTVIPNDKDQGQAVYDLSQMASQSGILLKSITFPTSNLGIKSLSIPATSGTSSTSSATSATAKAVVSQSKPVSGIPGLYSVQFTISPQTGPNIPPAQQDVYPKMIDFLSRIENNRRTAQITKVTIEPVPNTDQLSFDFTVNIFIKP